MVIIDITHKQVLSDIDNKIGLAIYPNPTNGFFTIEKIESFNETISVKILDINAKTIFNDVINAKQHKTEIDISEHSKGLYFIQFVIDGNPYSKKLIIQ